MRSRADLESVWRFCARHRDLLERSDQAGCFYCLAQFPPTAIEDWVDEPPSASGSLTGMPEAKGVTALCPRCGIDAVLPSAAVCLDAQLLVEMQAYYFGGP